MEVTTVPLLPRAETIRRSPESEPPESSGTLFLTPYSFRTGLWVPSEDRRAGVAPIAVAFRLKSVFSDC